MLVSQSAIVTATADDGANFPWNVLASSGMWNLGGFATPSAPAWILLDLKVRYPLARIALVVEQWPAGHATHTVLAGADPDALTVVATLGGAFVAGQTLTITLSQTMPTARYVKVITTQSCGWLAWRSVEVFASGPQATTIEGNAYATATSSYPANPPDAILDGNPATLWNAGGFAPVEITVHLNDAYALSAIDLIVSQSTPGQPIHEVLAGPDWSHLTTIATISGATYADGDTIHLPVSLRNVRVVSVRTRAGVGWVSWRGIRLTPAPPAPHLRYFGYMWPGGRMARRARIR